MFLAFYIVREIYPLVIKLVSNQYSPDCKNMFFRIKSSLTLSLLEI